MTMNPKTHLLRVGLPLLLLAYGCDGAEVGEEGPDAGPTADGAAEADAAVDLTEAMFDPDIVLDVSIEMEPESRSAPMVLLTVSRDEPTMSAIS